VPCPASPNCVCSDDASPRHVIASLRFTGPVDQAWSAAKQAVRALPGTRIISEKDDYLHAESTSALFGFVDDLELHLRREAGEIAVRSASRLGRSDFGVNRRRVERLRAALAGLIR
jgi:uncharacterized protein (DUF1499 family)